MKTYSIEIGFEVLTIDVADDFDAFDEAFVAYCHEEGGNLRINGWLIEAVEEIEAA